MLIRRMVFLSFRWLPKWMGCLYIAQLCIQQFYAPIQIFTLNKSHNFVVRSSSVSLSVCCSNHCWPFHNGRESVIYIGILVYGASGC